MTTYICKVTLCSALLLLLYKILFEEQKMHVFNRYYLLAGLVLSFVFPMITYGTPSTVLPVIANAFLNSRMPANIQTIHPLYTINNVNYVIPVIIIIYVAVASILLIRYLKNIKTILLKRHDNFKVLYENQKIVLIADDVIPHSFWNCIFLNREDYLKGKIENEILYHELSHVQQKHSFDILLIEFIQVIFWFNPFMFLYKKAIQLNHEFLADEAVVRKFKDAQTYQYVLLNQVSKQSGSPITSASNYLITKKRLIMMTKPGSFVQSLCRKVAVIPVFAISVLLFGTKTSAQQSSNDLDRSIRTMLERNITFPESLFKGQDGIALVHIFNSNDSIIIKSLYSSYKDYNFGMDRNLTEIANRGAVAFKLGKSELIVPVIFHYFDKVNPDPDLTLNPEAKKIIKQIGRQIDVTTPVIMIGGPR